MLKEMVSDKASYFRFIGTSVVEEEDQDYEDTGSRNSNHSVSVSSRSDSSLRLFVGSSPVEFTALSDVVWYKYNHEDNVKNNSSTCDLLSVLLEQKCTQFCLTQRCFLSKWTATHIRTDFKLQCKFHLDGTTSTDLSKYFVLKWIRNTSPSLSKWTKDVHDVSENIPGTLILTVPAVFMSAQRNVRALTSMMDEHIETFMALRTVIHPDH